MLFLIEYYAKNPSTGETGWSIHFAWVYAADQQEAREKIKLTKNFDVVIQCSEQSNPFPLACPVRDICLIR